MIDFAALVIQPCLNTFGRLLEYRPHASQAGAPPFAVQAIADNEFVAVEVAEGWVSSGNPQIGVRLSHFAVPPMSNDHIYFDTASWADRPEFAGKLFLVIEPKPDGQGHAKLTIREILP